jgi:deazaflavin-dependent oxidoreductase (nitroreductase family)
MDTSGRVSRFVQRTAAHPLFARVAPSVVPRIDRVLSRVTGGRVMLSQGIVPSLVLETVGARSGARRETPLATVPDGDGFYVVGSNFGRASHPAWSYNLLAHPSAVVVFRGRRIDVTAQVLDDAEKAAVWPRLTAIWSTYDAYEDRTARALRVFRLDPR